MRLSITSFVLIMAGTLLAVVLTLYAVAKDSPDLVGGAVQAFAAFATIALTVEIVKTSQETAALSMQVEARRAEQDQAIFEIAEQGWEGHDRVDFVIYNTGSRMGALREVALIHPTLGRFDGNGVQRVFGINDEKNDMSVPPGGRVRFRGGFKKAVPAGEREGFQLQVSPSAGRGALAAMPQRPV